MQKATRIYTLIVPSLDRKGPVNVATDIGAAAERAGWSVRILYLTEVISRDDLTFAFDVRKFRLSDIWLLRGVVHTHGLRPDLLSLLLCLNKNITLLTTIHIFFLIDLSFSEKRKYLVRAAWQVWKRSLKCFDHVICISKAMREYYIENIPRQQFDLVYNFRSLPSDLQVCSATAEWIKYRKSLNNIVLSFVGVLCDRKNILALANSLLNAKSISLVVCGDGPLHNGLVAIIGRYKLQDRIRLQGYVDSPMSIVQHTDALVLPSYAEGFPLVVIEAASVGVPSLLSDISVHRELVDLGFGLTFNHHNFLDFEAVAYELQKIFPVPSQRLMELWSNRFTPEAGFSQYEKLITSSHITNS